MQTRVEELALPPFFFVLVTALLRQWLGGVSGWACSGVHWLHRNAELGSFSACFPNSRILSENARIAHVYGLAVWRRGLGAIVPDRLHHQCQVRAGASRIWGGAVWRGDYAGGGRDCSPAPGETQGRHSVGTGPAPTGPFREILLVRHFSLDTLLGKNAHGGPARAGRCGGAAPAQGRAEGPTAQLQWSVVSGRWSVVSEWVIHLNGYRDLLSAA